MAGNCLSNDEKKCLVADIKNLLSAGISGIEITEDAWCSLLKLSVQEYVMELEMWLVKNQWSSLAGKDLTKTDICFALTQRSFDYETQFTFAYSKQVGLQARGNFELKKDYIVLEEGRQVYEIPAGREVNEVLWLTPSDIDHALFASMSAGGGLGVFPYAAGVGMNVGYGTQSGGSYLERAAYYIAPAYDVVLRAQDFGLKNRMLKSDLIYKITAGANGTKMLHLYSTPNYGNQIGIRKELYKCKVWYHYYDTEDMSAADKNKCLEECKDIIKYPSQIPLPDSDYCDLNSFSKTWVRKYLTALAKEALGRARGKFSGKIPIPDAEGQMDYESLLSEGKEERDKLKEELKEFLDYLSNDKIMERRAAEAESLNKQLSYRPLGIFVI